MNTTMSRRPIIARLRRSRTIRNAYAGTRDTLVLLREFFLPLLLLLLAVIIGGLTYYQLGVLAGETPDTRTEAVFLVLSMIFMQANTDFPHVWYLQAFFFVMPIIGLGILAQGVAEFGTLFFNRKSRGGAWQVALAEIFSNHVVLIGLGHVGMRVARELYNLGEEVVVIEHNATPEKLSAIESYGFPIITADANKLATLRQAGVERARSAIVCTSNDVLNLQMALKMKDLNPKLRLVVRVFDAEFASSLQQHFAFEYSFSASSLAAPVIAAAAIETDAIAPITLAGRVLQLARYTIRTSSALAVMTIGQLEQQYDVSIVLHQRAEKSDLHPPDTLALQAGDLIAVFADRNALDQIARANRDKTPQK